MSAANTNMDIPWDKLTDHSILKHIIRVSGVNLIVAFHVTYFKVFIDHFADLYRVSTLSIIQGQSFFGNISSQFIFQISKGRNIAL